jgi:hypothetical protein
MHTDAGDVLLSPEVLSSIGSVCQVAQAPDGHALLLSVTSTAAANASSHTDAPHSHLAPNAISARLRASQELLALPPPLQLKAVQVMLHLDLGLLSRPLRCASGCFCQVSCISILASVISACMGQVMRMHVMENLRQRIEAGHGDYINELRVCTTVFCGIPSLQVMMLALVPRKGMQHKAASVAQLLVSLAVSAVTQPERVCMLEVFSCTCMWTGSRGQGRRRFGQRTGSSERCATSSGVCWRLILAGVTSERAQQIACI